MVIFINNIKIEFCNCPITPVSSFAESELRSYLVHMFPCNIIPSKSFSLKLFSEGFKYDSYSIYENENNIEIASCHERGLLHGVYCLLEKLGCNFLFPGSCNQIIPQYNRWPLDEAISIKKEAWIEFRGLCLYNTVKETVSMTINAIDWMAKNGFNFLLSSIHRTDDTGCDEHAILWDEIAKEILPELQKRGIIIDISEHSTDYFFPKENLFKLHPDWFAKVNGVRTPGQICYSNLNAVEAYGNALANFTKDKDWFKFFGIWPLDGDGYCECDACSDPETIFNANSLIANKIKKVRPDLIVEHLAYTPQSFARPKKSMPNNMSVLVCSVRDKIAYEWALAAQNSGGAFYFDYMTADHYRYRSNVIINPAYCRETVNTLISYNYRGVISLYLPVECWFQSSINLWYLSQLYYNPTKSLESLHNLLALQLFGKNLQILGAKLLHYLTNDLFDKSLWSGFPHASDWYCEHITNRNMKIDNLHVEQFNEEYTKIMNLITEMKTQIGDLYLNNINMFIKFVELQKLYYHGVDQFNFDNDTPLRAEPYFEALSEINGKDGFPFISEEYARWRITGRDNIFDPTKTNLFQARD